uniref:GRF1-interacting factor 3 n=1 Tax=Aegilops tauschii subsp. strangulata TaxID=200361 RepID=A0A453K3B9_AEGTS
TPGYAHPGLIMRTPYQSRLACRHGNSGRISASELHAFHCAGRPDAFARASFMSAYQAQLQKNLLYLAAIADTQPQTSVSRPQMAPPSASPGAGHYMSQVPMFPPRTPLTPQQMQEQQLQQQQAQMLPFAGQMVARPGAVNGMPHAPQVEPAYAAGGASSEPSGTESHRSTGADNDGGSGLADQS